MEKTLFEKLFRRRPHPMLRLLGNLVLCTAQLVFVITVITHFDTPWRWLAVPFSLWAMLADSRGAVLAVQDLRRSDTAAAPE
ncbi:hypothetical protein ACFUJU_35570 [Streptomyces sp. NPDC057235]|uniref:hypothetical protein n=1 Tax=Streptomyces sp. NPDC057235 TaxID=3346058 RepID=UPI00362DD2D4